MPEWKEFTEAFSLKHSQKSSFSACPSSGSFCPEPGRPHTAWFQIVYGTGQGCTLSLVLFISTLRPLITIKNNDAIKII